MPSFAQRKSTSLQGREVSVPPAEAPERFRLGSVGFLGAQGRSPSPGPVGAVGGAVTKQLPGVSLAMTAPGSEHTRPLLASPPPKMEEPPSARTARGAAAPLRPAAA